MVTKLALKFSDLEHYGVNHFVYVFFNSFLRKIYRNNKIIVPINKMGQRIKKNVDFCMFCIYGNRTPTSHHIFILFYGHIIVGRILHIFKFCYIPPGRSETRKKSVAGEVTINIRDDAFRDDISR